MASAVTTSGDATKAWVLGFPSARLLKLRLNEWIMVFFFCNSAPGLFHIPIQGPQALANTFPPIDSNIAINPSLSMV